MDVAVPAGFSGDAAVVAGGAARWLAAAEDLHRSFWVSPAGELLADGVAGAAFCPACPAEALGDPAFRRDHGVRFAYVGGAMANGIASVKLVSALARAGMLGFFGAAGLAPAAVADAIAALQRDLGSLPFGVNLIHSPHEQDTEWAVADLLIERGVGRAEASAFLDLTPAVVRYRVAGVRRGADGMPVPARRLMAKVSRVEVAAKFLAPPPAALLRELLNRGAITAAEADLAVRLPMCDDLTAEADSGGHTDNRPALALVPTMIALRNRLAATLGFAAPRVGAAGGIATPQSVAAAFALGAGYVAGGTIHQACVESGSSDAVRQMLAEAGQADVAMAPAADMFEMGVKVQVLKRGTMFAMRGAKLFELYQACRGIDDIPAATRKQLEEQVFRQPLAEVWRQTREYFLQRDPRQVEKAEREPKHLMALVFRWYLGMASRWANAGEPTRKLDYQVWCGPAMGAFNEWAAGSFLAVPAAREIETVALNLMHHGAVLSRLHMLRLQGVAVPAAAERRAPLPKDEVRRRLGRKFPGAKDGT